MKKNQFGFIYIELLLSLAVISIFFLAAVPRILLTEKMKVDFQAQYLISSLRLIQQKNFALPHEARAVPTPYILINTGSYEIHDHPPDPPSTVTMPEGITLQSNNGRIFSFNRGDKYTASAATISISGRNYTTKITIHSYGRIRIAD